MSTEEEPEMTQRSGRAAMDAAEKWTMPINSWGIILNQLQVYFGERMDAYIYKYEKCKLL